MVLSVKNGASRFERFARNQDPSGTVLLVKIWQESRSARNCATGQDLTGIVLAIKTRQDFGARSQTDAMSQDP